MGYELDLLSQLIIQVLRMDDGFFREITSWPAFKSYKGSMSFGLTRSMDSSSCHKLSAKMGRC